MYFTGILKKSYINLNLIQLKLIQMFFNYDVWYLY